VAVEVNVRQAAAVVQNEAAAEEDKLSAGIIYKKRAW
jgi:hypothetical protein